MYLGEIAHRFALLRRSYSFLATRSFIAALSSASSAYIRLSRMGLQFLEPLQARGVHAAALRLPLVVRRWVDPGLTGTLASPCLRIETIWVSLNLRLLHGTSWLGRCQKAPSRISGIRGSLRPHQRLARKLSHTTTKVTLLPREKVTAEGVSGGTKSDSSSSPPGHAGCRRRLQPQRDVMRGVTSALICPSTEEPLWIWASVGGVQPDLAKVEHVRLPARRSHTYG